MLSNADGDVAIPCQLLMNGTVECERYVYTSVDEWKAQRDKIDRILHIYRRYILQLKVLSDFEARQLSFLALLFVNFLLGSVW